MAGNYVVPKYNTKCVCYGCPKKSISKGFHKDNYDGDRKVSFHKFPVDETRQSKWLGFIRRPDIKQIWETSSSKFLSILRNRYHICSTHFDAGQFMNPKLQKKLRHDAVPTIFKKDDPLECTAKDPLDFTDTDHLDCTTIEEPTRFHKACGYTQRKTKVICGDQHASHVTYVLEVRPLPRTAHLHQSRNNDTNSKSATTFDDCSSEGPCEHYIELIEEKARNHKLQRSNESLQLQIEDLLQRVQVLETAFVQNGFNLDDLSVKIEVEDEE